MKSAGKARNNGLYRHIRTSKEIIRNLLNDYYKKNKMTVKKAIAFVIIGCAVGYIGKKVIIGGSIGYLTGGVYANYASASSSAGYLFDYIKLIVEQVIIDGYMILSYKKVNGQLQEME